MKEKILSNDNFLMSILILAFIMVLISSFININLSKTIKSQRETVSSQQEAIEFQSNEIKRLYLVNEDIYGLFLECFRTSNE